MAESLNLPKTKDRATLYEAMVPQWRAIVEGEADLIANLANTAAALHETFQFLWIGFYLVKENQLVLGPFQGPIACTRIAFDRGVCGAAYRAARTLIVPNVDEFPGHIACSSRARSEIVVPLQNREGEIVGVLDIDSEHLSDFDEIDQRFLESIVEIIAQCTSGFKHRHQ